MISKCLNRYDTQENLTIPRNNKVGVSRWPYLRLEWQLLTYFSAIKECYIGRWVAFIVNRKGGSKGIWQGCIDILSQRIVESLLERSLYFHYCIIWEGDFRSLRRVFREDAKGIV